jgi:hypothetical protein
VHKALQKSCISSGILTCFSRADLRTTGFQRQRPQIRSGYIEEGSGFNIIPTIKISRLVTIPSNLGPLDHPVMQRWKSQNHCYHSMEYTTQEELYFVRRTNVSLSASSPDEYHTFVILTNVFTILTNLDFINNSSL